MGISQTLKGLLLVVFRFPIVLLSNLTKFVLADNKRHLLRMLFSPVGAMYVLRLLQSESTTRANKVQSPNTFLETGDSNVGHNRILVVEWDFPEPASSAGDWTVLTYLTGLKRSGFDVAALSLSGNPHVARALSLESKGIRTFFNGQQAISWVSGDPGKSLVVVARPLVAWSFLQGLDDSRPFSVFYYTHDLHHKRLFSQAVLEKSCLVKLEAWLMKRLEQKVFDSVDLILSPSADETLVVKSLTKTSAITIPPYFFNEEDIQTEDSPYPDKNKTLLFVGNFQHSPNIDAALYLAESIFPLVLEAHPDANLAIVGNEPVPRVLNLQSSNIEVLGRVADLKEIHLRSRILVAPLRVGAGVKGKVVDALRYGIPVAGSAIAWEGIDLVKTAIRPIDLEPKAFAFAICDLLDNQELSNQYTQDGRRILRSQFSETRFWELTRLLKRYLE
jgi:glycosyltransferase involved in cell wall biosynthesis